MAVNVVDLMDEQEEQGARAATVKSYKPTFLILKDGQKAIFRPLTNLDGCAVMDMHGMFHPTDWKLSIDAACACEIGKPCKNCLDAANNKKLTARRTFFLAVYLYRIICLKDIKKKDGTILFKKGEVVAYPDPDDNDTLKTESGVRLLKLTYNFGTIATAAASLKTRYREGDNLIRRDFSLERIGGDQQTKYVLDPKDPSPFKLADRIAAPSVERIRERVLEACPPMIVTSVSQQNGIEVPDMLEITSSEDDIADF
jgi:hypothetical protein